MPARRSLRTRTTRFAGTQPASRRRSVSVRRRPAARTPRGITAWRRGRLRRYRSARSAQTGVRHQLRAFRQASTVAVALTGLLLLLVPETVPAQETDTAAALDTVTAADTLTGDAPPPSVRPDSLVREASAEATGALRSLWLGFVQLLPKLFVALLVLFVAWLAVRLLRPLVRGLTGRFERTEAYTALFGILCWLLAIGVVVSVLAGDIRALVGSLGLVGLALSWSLQTPIESFTGWLLNSFQGYYRVGDRVAVGEVHGDVYHIDFLTTTVWEIGGPDSPSGIQAEQPTGRMITFPNSEVLSGTVVNYTRDFPFVWDELAVSVAAESDLSYAIRVVEETAARLVGEGMQGPAQEYARVLERTPLDEQVAESPEVFAALTDWGVNLVVRYLVAVRKKRATKSRLGQALLAEVNRPEHAGKILPAYPREQVQLVGPGGDPQPWPEPGER